MTPAGEAILDRSVLDDRTSHLTIPLHADRIGQYLVLDLGWNGDKYLHATPIHLSAIGDKVWVQYDDTEESVVTDLMEAGIPRENIVLGFRHPKLGQHTGFAVA
ncbi:MAG: hypothetical protein CLLPBCKN_000693 [Chroococcidiopsis cubana SAG 39.79]|uniref:XisI protein n=1 Tax=Chroococcidiopsis cubana SAG 39.79 TaxID=388085 RepID=A0AB37UKM5_9CYAN|nr:element excision factor XisI family protein [Chroococcidiopsis cubana]MDZ4871305.1 hypothetical protein [Chroococcidiopsis cubana SAG 39.79]PSB63018.1 XisI protein [Chroococcidiopsis cubana CCALA 043]RUT11933.1 hypothetical protein DSM107010_27410 [Chroococcidiopsis cubana SAG 39.79]